MRASDLLAALLLVAGLVGPARAENEAEKPADRPVEPRLTWKDGKTTAEFSKAQLNLTSRIQIRFTDAPDATGEHVGSFRLRRARTSVDGWLYGKELQFELMVDWVDEPLLEDLNLNWDVSRGKAFQVKVGQFKVPFGRQELTSDTGQQFVDRSIVSAEFAKGRDQGVQLWGQLAKGRLEYRAGVFNGNGRGRATNDNPSFQYDGRLVFQPWGDAKYSEGDFESEGHPLVALGVDFERNDARTVTTTAGTAAPAGSMRVVTGADLMLKYRGLSLMAEGFRRTITPAAGRAYLSNGYHLQAGWFVRRNVLEAAVRYAAWEPNKAPNDRRSEKGLAVSYFLNRHLLKVQADGRRITDANTRQRHLEVRGQLQFLF
jgi:hypothetical protein